MSSVTSRDHPSDVTVAHKKVKRAGGRSGVVGTAMQRLEVRHAVGVEPNHFGINNC
jgi:hypothetical protein